jgi:hypothetical protein
MDLQVLAAHNFCKDMILDEIDAKIVTAASATTHVSASASTPAAAFTSTPASAFASASTPATTTTSSPSADQRGTVGVAKPLLLVLFGHWSVI